MSSSLCAEIAVKEEVAYGVNPGGTFIRSSFLDGGLVADGAILSPKTNNGYLGDAYPLPGPYGLAGSFNMLAAPAGVNALFFKGLFGVGSVGTVALGGGAYRHTLTMVAACGNPPSFAVYEDLQAMKKLFLGCCVNTMDFSCDVKAEGKIAWNLMGQKDQVIAEPTTTLIDPRGVVWSDVAVTLNNAVNLDTEKIGIKVDRGLEAVFTNNQTRYARRMISKDLVVTGSFGMEFNDVYQQEIFWGQVGATAPTNNVLTVPLIFDFVSPNQIGVSGFYESIKWEFPAVAYEKAEATFPSRDRIMQDVVWRGFQDTNTGEVVTLTLTNGQATI